MPPVPSSPPDAPPEAPAEEGAPAPPEALAARIERETGIDLSSLRNWWSGDAAMPSRAFCRLGLARIIDLVLDDRRDEVLSCPDLWVMQDAFSATDVAPADVDVERLLEWLRAEAIATGAAPTDHRVFRFYSRYRPALEKWGRLEASDVGLGKAAPKEDRPQGFLGRLFGRGDAAGERLPLREIQDIPSFFKYLDEVEAIRQGKGPEVPEKAAEEVGE